MLEKYSCACSLLNWGGTLLAWLSSKTSPANFHKFLWHLCLSLLALLRCAVWLDCFFSLFCWRTSSKKFLAMDLISSWGNPFPLASRNSFFALFFSSVTFWELFHASYASAGLYSCVVALWYHTAQQNTYRCLWWEDHSSLLLMVPLQHQEPGSLWSRCQPYSSPHERLGA